MYETAEQTKDEDLAREASRLESHHALTNSVAGQLGQAIEPIIEPLGFDWQIGVGVISSFAAREVIVSTLSIVYGVGEDVADDWIAERCERGEVVVTNDIPLAARCLQKGARVIRQKGHEMTSDSIGEALAGRELSQNLREMGLVTGGPEPMTAKDKSRFLGKLDQILVALDRRFPV